VRFELEKSSNCPSARDIYPKAPAAPPPKTSKRKYHTTHHPIPWYLNQARTSLPALHASIELSIGSSNPLSFVQHSPKPHPLHSHHAPKFPPPLVTGSSQSHHTIDTAAPSARDLEPDAREYREEMGGHATAGAGGSVDGVEGSHEGQLGRIDAAGEESRFVFLSFLSPPNPYINTAPLYTLQPSDLTRVPNSSAANLAFLRFTSQTPNRVRTQLGKGHKLT
jgi:hypothetical protein